jgi:hypothetical protein
LEVKKKKKKKWEKKKKKKIAKHGNQIHCETWDTNFGFLAAKKRVARFFFSGYEAVTCLKNPVADMKTPNLPMMPAIQRLFPS